MTKTIIIKKNDRGQKSIINYDYVNMTMTMTMKLFLFPLKHLDIHIYMTNNGNMEK